MSLPLFDRFACTASLPVAGIAELPTPLEPLLVEALSDAGLAALEVKRDDLTSPRYGGNKVRKLDFLLGDAVAHGCKAVLTFGAYGSNHALATAVHARALGLEPHVVLSPQEPGPYAPRTLLAHAGLGSVIHLVDGWDGRREAVLAMREIAKRDGIEPYEIPMGGTNALGAVGYVNAALEVAAQTAAADRPAPDVVYAAAGTLGTVIGLAVGFSAAGLPTRVEGVRVTPGEIANEQLAEKIAGETVALLRSLDPSFPQFEPGDLAFALRHEFFEPGYGVVTPETTSAVEMGAEAGVTLETTYTGKAFSAMYADARASRLAGERVLFWDTYNSAPYPEPGRIEALPRVLQDYIAECRRRYPHA